MKILVPVIKKMLFILSLFTLGFLSCKGKSGEMKTIGKWRPIEMNLQGIDENEKKDMIDHLILDFTGDGKFTIIKKEMKQKGTYTFDEKEKKMTLTNDSENAELRTQVFTISWEGEKMIMKNEQGKITLKRD